jgi:Ca-activated chloride channel homolog
LLVGDGIVNFNQFHFAHPLWLWFAIIIPFVWIVFFLFYRKYPMQCRLEEFIDSHLLPYLLINPGRKHSSWKTLFLWTFLWSCLTLALAGPRWSFREIDTFSKDQNFVILLDLSESMNATDVQPSRLVHAKRKIEDILNLAQGIKIGLIAFAADAHMITPLTEDKETVLHLLSSLETSIMYVQGSRLSSALDMASNMLEKETGDNKTLLIISDGGFEDSSAIVNAKKLAGKGVVIHTMGIGTTEGAILSNDGKNSQKKSPSSVFSKLEKERLIEISNVGKGRYLDGQHHNTEETMILKDIEERAETHLNLGKKRKFWDEHFYLMIFPVLPLMLWWFRHGRIFILVFAFFIPTLPLTAGGIQDYLKNSEERGKDALNDGNFEIAVQTFQDPYRKGIAFYKAKNFIEAEKMFRESSRPEVASSAAYNLANSLVEQQKLKEAVAAYEEVIEKWPNHVNAKENLEIVKKMLEKQEQNSSESGNSEQQDQEKDSEDQNSSGDSSSQDNPDQSRQQSQKTNENSEEQNSQKNEKAKQSEKNDKHKTDQNDSKEGLDEQQTSEEMKIPEKEDQQRTSCKSQEDLDADLWLNKIETDPKNFLKNKCYIESKKNGIKEGIDPW